MEFPIEVNLDITQDDFICADILEQAADIPRAKKDAKTAFAAETAALAVCAVLAFVFRNRISPAVIYIIAAFWLFFRLNFCYNYFLGIDREFKMSVTHLLSSNGSHTFYRPEKGIAFFYPDRGEYLTNEQRRYFDYSLIQHIKITRHLFIFVMKRSKDKGLRGFAWMILPKRNLTERQEKDFTRLCREIEKKYGLTPWTDCRLFD